MANTAAVPASKLPGIIERLKSGATALITESKALGFTHNGPLRTALRAQMGMDAYNALMASKRPTALKRPRTESGELIIRPLPDDKGLPVIEAMTKSAGWTWRLVSEHEPRPVAVQLKEGTATLMDTGDQLRVMISPEGVEYVLAGAYEKADILRADPINPKSPPLRFVRWEHSDTRKKVERHLKEGDALMQRGEAALQRKRDQARAKKAAEAAPVEAPPEPARNPRKRAPNGAGRPQDRAKAKGQGVDSPKGKKPATGQARGKGGKGQVKAPAVRKSNGKKGAK